ncbi:threonine/serine dehydratase [Sphingomonas sp. MG17]|uniref:Threonine/serine dehydratase n=1 Tax=Sphingomonas tagetis TaxID=2949092 RepID=A0A9X2HQ54_9SPHN|nr:threonine/serine dehydratase [Sphingomonas tagetis]MCP3729945.1 threonine/serine dehydratase [Sphingomonas tagetis]
MNDLIDRIHEAEAAIRPIVMVSPLERSNLLSSELDCDVWLKADHLQPTGSFKLRGATNFVRLVADEHKEVITASTGNHGRAVAHAGAAFGVNAIVYLSNATRPSKIQAIRDAGAEIVMIDGSVLDAELAARAESERRGIPYVAAYNHLATVAGQGTMGVELVRQAPDLDAVFVCLGCGGLAGGLGIAVKALSPATRLIGVSAANSKCMIDSLNAGEIIETPETETLADGSAGAVEPGSVTFPICQQVIDETLTVSEQEIAQAMRKVAEGNNWIVEGSAGVAVAGLIQTAERYRGRKVAVILCGRNIALDTFMGAMARAT